jgi:hypothetical protein
MGMLYDGDNLDILRRYRRNLQICPEGEDKGGRPEPAKIVALS